MAEQSLEPAGEQHRVEPVEIKLEDFFTKVLSVIGQTTDLQVAELLKKSQLTISTAESVTGGLIASRLTSVPGSSDYFIGGLVSYATRVKVSQLGVPAATINKFGVVSKETAMAMADEVKKRFKTDLALASTGAAGPDPVPPAPVGKVYIALASDRETEWKELNLQGSRNEIRDKAAQAALGLLWLYLGGEKVI